MHTPRRDAIRIKNRYEVINAIASGGMATVYRGWDYNTDRFVAIKALRPPEHPSADPFAAVRFRREAQAAAKISHPNVVMIYDFVEERGGQFLIMEYVDGINLKREIADRGPLPFPRAFKIAEQMCAALAASHARGLIHRDIKPQNILLTEDGRARLTDFGIVHVTDGEALTQGGFVLGTADYLSPEQARGDHLGPQSDMYSLGVVLFEMLTGVPPFTGVSPVSIAMQHATETIPPLSAFNPNLPVEVEAVVRRAVERDAKKRYQSAVLMGRALQTCRQQLTRPVPLRPARARHAAQPLPLWFSRWRRKPVSA